jgi:eukaryotic-like serine/threonine-protein kinase
VHGPGTGVHPVPPGPPPMGNTYPPGIIPPQQPVQQQAVQQHQVSQQQAPMPVPANAAGVAGAMGGNAHRESGNTRVVVWILVAVLAVVLLVAIGLLTYWAVNRHDLGMAGRGPVATLSLDSTNGLGQTSHRQEPMIGMPPAGEMGRSLTRIGTTIR